MVEKKKTDLPVFSFSFSCRSCKWENLCKYTPRPGQLKSHISNNSNSNHFHSMTIFDLKYLFLIYLFCAVLFVNPKNTPKFVILSNIPKTTQQKCKKIILLLNKIRQKQNKYVERRISKLQ